ncbi:MAG TPA: bifunctional adenosylcobinamide kinase/adenosylcobinamide-phosphate guanylyltransferase [Chloroflexota bacterium]
MSWRHILVLGGARSGKSAFAQRLASQCGEPVVYVATATETDAEMAERIARHRAERPAAWRTIETPSAVAERLAAEHAAGGGTVLLEDLTLLLSNLMETGGAAAEATALGEVDALMRFQAHLVMVSNEVGMGLVPPYPLGRVFRDALGRVNQAAAAACDEVYFVLAGLPQRLK